MSQASQTLHDTYPTVNTEPFDSLVGPEIPTEGIEPGFGFLKVSHILVDSVMPQLGPSVFCVYLALYRASWGWHRNYVKLTSTRALAKQMNLSVGTVNVALRTLQNEGLVIKHKEYGPKGSRYVVRLPMGCSVDDSRSSTVSEIETVARPLCQNSERYCVKKCNTVDLLKESLKKEEEEERKDHPTPQPESSQEPETEPEPDTSIESEIVAVLVQWALTDPFHGQNLQGRSLSKQRAYVRRNHDKILHDYGQATGDRLPDLRRRLAACHQWGHRAN